MPLFAAKAKDGGNRNQLAPWPVGLSRSAVGGRHYNATAQQSRIDPEAEKRFAASGYHL